MQTNKLLSLFEYTEMPSVSSVSIAETSRLPIARHAPLLQVKINFKNGEFNLRGTWHFIMASNQHAHPDWFSYHTGNVEINADIYPGEVDLDDNNNDRLVFPIVGDIKDESSLNSCSGLIQFDKAGSGQGINNHEWNISICLYDHQDDKCEIKLNLPVYITGCKENN